MGLQRGLQGVHVCALIYIYILSYRLSHIYPSFLSYPIANCVEVEKLCNFCSISTLRAVRIRQEG